MAFYQKQRRWQRKGSAVSSRVGNFAENRVFEGETRVLVFDRGDDTKFGSPLR